MKIKDSVAILGQGYVGLPLAMAAQEAGWNVYGLDLSEERVRRLRMGQSFIEDVSDEKLQSALAKGYTPTSNFAVLGEVSIAVVCVPTPLDSENQPDLSPLESAVRTIASYAKEGTLIINESTSFPSTVREIIPKVVAEVNPELKLLYAVAPERVDPGNAEWGYRETPRLVGGLTEEATNRAVDFYSSFCNHVVRVESPEIAEFSKVLENSFRQVNIALVNELIPLARELNVSLFDVIEAASTKPYGFMPFWPGVGVGGHCIPIDPMYLAWLAKSKGSPISLIEQAQMVNQGTPTEVWKQIKKLCLAQHSSVLQVGIAYKPRVSDVRESPSVELFEFVSSFFSRAQWWDSSIEEWNGTARSTLDEDFDLVIVTHRIGNDKVEASLKKAKVVIDCTGQYRHLPNVQSI
jgi:UDP-N-acetyl-D-glucosamine dehydrogenase